MQSVILVDTSVLLNILNVPGLNQDHEAIMDEFEELVESGVNLLLPVGAVFETGNHIARLADGRQRGSMPNCSKTKLSLLCWGVHRGHRSSFPIPRSWPNG